FEATVRERQRAVAQARDTAARERLALIENMQKLLSEEARRLADEIKALNIKHVDLASYKEEIAAVEAVAKKVQAEVEMMAVEINAQARVQLIESAEAPAD